MATCSQQKIKCPRALSKLQINRNIATVSAVPQDLLHLCSSHLNLRQQLTTWEDTTIFGQQVVEFWWWHCWLALGEKCTTKDTKVDNAAMACRDGSGAKPAAQSTSHFRQCFSCSLALERDLFESFKRRNQVRNIVNFFAKHVCEWGQIACELLCSSPFQQISNLFSKVSKKTIDPFFQATLETWKGDLPRQCSTTAHLMTWQEQIEKSLFPSPWHHHDQHCQINCSPLCWGKPESYLRAQSYTFVQRLDSTRNALCDVSSWSIDEPDGTTIITRRIHYSQPNSVHKVFHHVPAKIAQAFASIWYATCQLSGMTMPSSIAQKRHFLFHVWVDGLWLCHAWSFYVKMVGVKCLWTNIRSKDEEGAGWLWSDSVRFLQGPKKIHIPEAENNDTHVRYGWQLKDVWSSLKGSLQQAVLLAFRE